MAYLVSDEKLYKTLLEEGNVLISKVISYLNPLSNEFIQNNKEEYRREKDFKEICVALALYDRVINNKDI